MAEYVPTCVSKGELKNLLKWASSPFSLMVDREIFTYLKNVWNNPFGVDVLLVEKPGA